MLITVSVLAQNSNRVYLSHGHNYGTDYSYGVSEIEISKDSLYVWRSWSMSYKKEWRSYKEYEPNIKKGTLKQNGEFFILEEHTSEGVPNGTTWIVKISDRRLKFFYYLNDKLRRGANYKRLIDF